MIVMRLLLLEEVIASLPVAEDITSALLYYEGLLGSVWRCTLAYEPGRWEDVDCSGLERGAIIASYMEGITWATKADAELVAS